MAKTTWFLVADGARARLLTMKSGRGTGQAQRLEPVLDREFIGSNIPSREIDADRPGRTFDSAGEGRHAMEPPTDPRRKRKADFARSIANLLDGEAKRGAFDQLVVAAPPQALGDLRAEFSSSVQALVTAEINKDLVESTNEDLASRLSEVLTEALFR